MEEKILRKTIEIKIEEFYYTSDLCLAAILKMNSFPIVKWESIERSPTAKKLVFYFDKNSEMLKLVYEYFNLPIKDHPLKRFYAELREIKNLIYNS